MKYTLIINQAGVVHNGILGQVDLRDISLLHYIKGWGDCKKASFELVEGHRYVWIDFRNAVEELPILFNPNASDRTKINQVCELVKRLRAAGLLETKKVGRRLYVRASDLAERVLNFRENITNKADTSITSHHDGTDTSRRDDTVIDSRDDQALTYIVEQETREQDSIEQTTTSNAVPGECVSLQFRSIGEQAEAIYETYPRKVARPKAIKEIRAALQRFSFKFVFERTKLYASTRNCPPRYIPFPANFFRDELFNDDPETWRQYDPPTLSRRPELIRPDQFGCGVTKLQSPTT
jgi:hypothetical protein